MNTRQQTTAEERTKFIYALRCPVTNEVRYIGASTNPVRRYYSHLSDGVNARKRAWLRALKTMGRRPELIILDRCKWAEHRRVEDGWTHYFIAQGNDIVNGIYSGYSRLALRERGSRPGYEREYFADELARLSRQA